MKTCHIFCAGLCGQLLEQPEPGDWILAADGGLLHCRRFGLTPTRILGDFDSLGQIPAGDVDCYPVEKDDTDSMLAVKTGLEAGFRRFLIYGGLDGPRLDHTVANFQLLAYLQTHGAWGALVGQTYLVSVFGPGRTVFPEKAKGILSLFCMGEPVRGLSLHGLQYPLEQATLRHDFPLGVSNHFTGEPAEITLRSGAVLALWDVENGLPVQLPWEMQRRETEI